MNYKNKTVVITGASSDLGMEIAKIFAKNNANIVIHYYQNEARAKELQEDLEKHYGTNCLLVKADISKEDEVQNMIREIIKKYRGIDVLINNASMSNDGNFFTKDMNSVKTILEVNAIGTYFVSREIGNIMKGQNCGSIINISSDNAIDSGYPESVDYDMSKAAIISLTHDLAKAIAPIRVNCVAPGWINTSSTIDMNPEFKKNQINKCLLNRFADPEEIANVVFFLAGEEASYINDTIIKVDGGKQ